MIVNPSTVPPYFVFGRQNIGVVACPARTGTPLSFERKIIDQFVLGADQNRPVYGVPSTSTGGTYDEWVLPSDHQYEWGVTPWPNGWQNNLDPTAYNEGYSINVARLQTYLATIATRFAAEEEYWWMPNLESNAFVEFHPYLPDPYNPTEEMTQRAEYLNQSYRFLAAKFRQAKPNGCFAYYCQRAMLAHPYDFGTPFTSVREAMSLRNKRYGYSRVNGIINRDEGLHDCCDAIVGEVYVHPANGSESFIINNIHDQMDQIHEIRKPNQLAGMYISPQYIAANPEPNLSDRLLTIIASELRKTGCHRLIVWGFMPDDGVSAYRYWNYWKPKYDLIASCFI